MVVELNDTEHFFELRGNYRIRNDETLPLGLFFRLRSLELLQTGRLEVGQWKKRK